MSNELMTATQSQHVFANAQSFETAQRIAGALSKSTLVPKEYQNNLPNSLIALEIAQRTGSSPLLIMQNLYIVHGKPSWSSQFIIAAINSCGRFKPLRFDMTGTGDDRTCIAWTVERNVELPPDVGTLEQAKAKNLPILESPPVSIKIAKAEGWFQKNGSKWQTMPELMQRYRAATFFGRLYAPEILMGMKAEDEVQDMIDVTPKESTILTNLNEAIKAEAAKVTEVTPEPEAKPENTELAKWIDDICNAPNIEGVAFKFDAASKIFVADADAMAQLMIIKQEREKSLKGSGKKLFAKPEDTQAA